MTIKAVFFDSGHTLMRPVGNRWFPGMRFFDISHDHGVVVPDDEALQQATIVGYEFLEANHDKVPDVDAEQAQFRYYFEIIFAQLGVDPTAPMLDELAHSSVHDVNFQPYPDTRRLLDDILARGLSMALLTDGWPSTRTKYDDLGFLTYFDAFVISAEQRCTKPAWGMFEPALNKLRVAPDEVVFIDDGPAIVTGALAYGFQAHRIDHEGEHPDAGLHGYAHVRALLDAQYVCAQ